MRRVWWMRGVMIVIMVMIAVVMPIPVVMPVIPVVIRSRGVVGELKLRGLVPRSAG